MKLELIKKIAVNYFNYDTITQVKRPFIVSWTFKSGLFFDGFCDMDDGCDGLFCDI